MIGADNPLDWRDANVKKSAHFFTKFWEFGKKVGTLHNTRPGRAAETP